MSLWSSCEGSYRMSKDCSFSLKKFLKKSIITSYDYHLDYEQSTDGLVRFNFVFSADGHDAVEIVKDFVDLLSKTTGVTIYQINSVIRWR